MAVIQLENATKISRKIDKIATDIINASTEIDKEIRTDMLNIKSELGDLSDQVGISMAHYESEERFRLLLEKQVLLRKFQMKIIYENPHMLNTI